MAVCKVSNDDNDDLGIAGASADGCGAGMGERDALLYMTAVSDSDQQIVLEQLVSALGTHKEQLAALEELSAAARQRSSFYEASLICQRITDSMDALRRAQAVATMIRKSSRLPKSMRHEASTGQLRQPPRLAAAVDPASGMYHAFAIYELRSGDVACGGRFHVYVTDLFNMRSLLPFQTCWRPAVASSLISLLQRQTEAEQQVVVLRALSDAPRLEGYYERIGFTSEQREFERAGLSESFVSGDMLFYSESGLSALLPPPAAVMERVELVENML